MILLKMTSLFKPNQIDAGNKVIEYFKSGISKYCLLEAQMQSGKTGTYNWVIKQILHEKLVTNILIISGSNEILLKNQAIKDLQYYNPDLIHLCDIYFRSDLKKIKDVKNTLIIIDESHLDQTNDQLMSKFLRDFGLWGDGDISILNTLNTYILSVSATPFSEISNIYYGKSSNSKKIVKLIAGNEYKGVQYFLDNNLIKPTFDILENIDKFKNLILDNGNKYNIVRILADNTINETLLKLNTSNNINCYVYDSTKNTSIYLSNEERILLGGSTNIPTLEVEPTKPSIILIKGKLRVGKVLPKQYIGFVWENSKTPNSDTILQGLLGRCCGYHNYNINIYVSSSLLDKYSFNGGVELNELERYIREGYIPTTGNNLKSLSTQLKPSNKKSYITTKPIKISFNKNNSEYNDYDVIFTDKNNTLKKKIIYDKLIENDFNIIRNGIYESQINNVIEIIQSNYEKFKKNEDSQNITIRNYENSKYYGELDKLTNSYINNLPYKGNHGIVKDRYIDMVVSIIYEGYNYLNNNCKPGDVFVFFYTKKNNDNNNENIRQRITETTGNEIFNNFIRNNSFDSKEFIHNPDDFMNFIKSSINTYKSNILRLSKKRVYKIKLDNALLEKENYFNNNTDKINKKNAQDSYFWKNINKIETELKIEININKSNLIKLGKNKVKINELEWNIKKTN
jgi:hypothetical protein